VQALGQRAGCSLWKLRSRLSRRSLCRYCLLAYTQSAAAAAARRRRTGSIAMIDRFMQAPFG
jgi:hypothetical protein